MSASAVFTTAMSSMSMAVAAATTANVHFWVRVMASTFVSWRQAGIGGTPIRSPRPSSGQDPGSEMCGFAGELRTQGRADVAVVDRMAGLCDRRGPDGAGLWAHDGVAFAHRDRRSVV